MAARARTRPRSAAIRCRVAAALATIELLEQELIDNAARMGDYMMDRMAIWPKRFPNVGDVRGLGLMIGVELVTRPGDHGAAPELRDRVVERAFERGLLVLGAGREHDAAVPAAGDHRRDQADFAVDTLEECLT